MGGGAEEIAKIAGIAKIEKQTLNHRGHKGTRRKTSEPYANLGCLGMRPLNSFGILVNGWGEGVALDQVPFLHL
jgi:hypothetical protein